MVVLTKIIATVGPACEEIKTLVRLIEEGARVFRLNFSHGLFEHHERRMMAVRQASEIAGVPVAILGDLSGPKIRVGKVRDGGVMLNIGDQVDFQRPALITGVDEPLCKNTTAAVTFNCTYPDLVNDVEPGQRMLIDDGAIRLLVTEAHGSGEDRRLSCSVTVGGLVTSSKGVNLPDTPLSLPSLTAWDLKCVDWAIQHKLDYLALSFVRSGKDITELKALLSSKRDGLDAPIPVVAKIEKPQALDDLDAICAASDAIMVARGDLGVEMDLSKVPVMQKRIIRAAHDHGKPVIVATQMLQSMIESAGPTRAEVSDVANAIYESVDAVMLSGETAVGKYPIQAVAVMSHIAREVERDMASDPQRKPQPPRKLQETRYRTAALAHGVSVVVEDLRATLVATWSELGGGARYLSQNRLGVPIVAASSNPPALRRMALLFGVTPVFMDRPQTALEFLQRMEKLVLERGYVIKGDAVVIADGEPLGTAGVTNRLRIHYMGDSERPWNHPGVPTQPPA